jgi:medium-chain acyl-[acyl-carrier-protein] hydrolase
MSKIKLFCLPYAGGSAAVFDSWKKHLHPDIKLRPIELAGRGHRILDALYRDGKSAVEDLMALLAPEIQENTPYAFFGHSMGCVLAVRILRQLIEQNVRPPVHAFFSGHAAPHIAKPEDKVYHLMDDHTFRKEILALGGTPPEFFQHPELVDLFVPVLKNDFKIVEESVDSEPVEFEFPISVLLGKHDDLSDRECHEWKYYAKDYCTLYYLNGGHFFLNEITHQVVNIINSSLAVNLRKPSPVAR